MKSENPYSGSVLCLSVRFHPLRSSLESHEDVIAGTVLLSSFSGKKRNRNGEIVCFDLNERMKFSKKSKAQSVFSIIVFLFIYISFLVQCKFMFQFAVFLGFKAYGAPLIYSPSGHLKCTVDNFFSLSRTVYLIMQQEACTPDCNKHVQRLSRLWITGNITNKIQSDSE